MRTLFFTLSVLVFAACNDSGDADFKRVPSDLSLEKLNGIISSIEETPYLTDNTGKMLNADTCCVKIWNYDSAGYLNIYTERKYGGTIKQEVFNSRYPSGMWKSSYTQQNHKIFSRLETTKNKKGNYERGVETDSAGNILRIYRDIVINDNGQLLSWKQLDKDSILHTQGENTYDTLNLRTSFVLKDSVGNITKSSVYKYDTKGRLTEEIITENTGGIASVKTKKYTYESDDDKGNWTQRTEWDENGIAKQVVVREYFYND